MVASRGWAASERAAGVVTWTQYGAKGDGVTDDTAAINACMLDAYVNGYAVHVANPAVSYRITAPVHLYDGAKLRGQSPEATKVFCDRTSGLYPQNSENGHTSDWLIEDIQFNGNDDVATDGADHVGLWLKNCTRFECNRVDVRGFTDMVWLDGRINANGNRSTGTGVFRDCRIETNNANPQKNPLNNYPRRLVRFLSEQNGQGGSDGVTFINCRIYGELLADSRRFSGDGATDVFAFGAIKSGKLLTDETHLVVETTEAAGGDRLRKRVGVDFTVSGVDTNTPSIDFGISSPPPAIPLLATTGDGATKSFRLGARPTFGEGDGGRDVSASVDGSAQVPGDDYYIVDANGGDFAIASVDSSADTIVIGERDIQEFLKADGVTLATGRLVRFSTTGTLPGGLSAGTDYYATGIDLVNGAFKAAATYEDAVAGSPSVVDLTDVGSGVHKVELQNAIEFEAAPGVALAIAVNDINMRVKWVDPNVETCVELSKGCQRIGFISCKIGGGKYGIDFADGRRSIFIDNYFQICEYAVRFGKEAEDCQGVGYSARTDSNLVEAFALDEADSQSNSFDNFLPRDVSAREQIWFRNEVTAADDASGRIQWSADQLRVESRPAAGSVALRANGETMLIVDAASDYVEIRDADGNAMWRSGGSGDLTPRGASGAQSLGDATHVLKLVFASGFLLTDGVTAPTAAAGFGQLFIDQADGDLKVIFGDGVIKTIAADT